MKFEFFDRFLKKFQISNFIKNPSKETGVAPCGQKDGRTDTGRDETEIAIFTITALVQIIVLARLPPLLQFMLYQTDIF